MFAHTPVRRIGTLSTFLANTALSLAHYASLQTPYAALTFSGAVFRCLSLPLTLYGDQCLSRMAAALPELQDVHHTYLSIVDHPRAISWEKKVATQKLQNDRERVFRSYRTNNVKMVVPHLAGMALSLYTLGAPAQQIGSFFVADAGMDIANPLAFSYTGSLGPVTTAGSIAWAVDPTLSIAAALTCWNVCVHLNRRKGFNTRLDQWIENLKLAVISCCSGVVVMSLVASPLASLVGFSVPPLFPPYLAPVWLGMSATTALKNCIVNATAPGRAMFCIAPYPLQHGTYGAESTAAGHAYRLAFTGIDVEERHDAWQSQKRILDYECDVRLHRTLQRLGVFDDIEELEHEAGKLARKREVARARRLEKEDRAKRNRGQAEDHTDDRSSASQQVDQLEDIQQALNHQRKTRQESREAAWKLKHPSNQI